MCYDESDDDDVIVSNYIKKLENLLVTASDSSLILQFYEIISSTKTFTREAEILLKEA